MNIRFKVLTLKLISTMFLLVTYSLFSKNFVISGFEEVEREEAVSDTEVMLETFNAMVLSLDNKSADWAGWDDSYKYVQGKFKSFEKENFLPETMKVMNIDYFAFYDLKGRSVGQRAFDKTKETFVSYPESLQRIFRPGSKLFSFGPKETSRHGVLSIPEGLIMFSLRPVFDSKMHSPSKGYVLMVRRITNETIAKISEITGRLVSLENPGRAEQLYGLDMQKNIVQKEISDQMIYGMAVLHDFHHIPVAVLKSEIPRKILQIGQASYRKTMTFFTAVILLISLAMILFLDRMLVKRLADLDKQVKLQDQNGVSSLTVSGNDEITRLAKSMNKMLGTLNARNQELMNLNEIIKHQNQALVSAAKMSALGEMAGGVAHEINTPLTVIKLRSEMMMNELTESGPAGSTGLKRSLEIIDKTVDRITKIIQSLRAFSRETQGLEKVQYSVSEILSEALNLCFEKFKMHGIDLNIDSPEDFKLICRPTEIAQVLINLLNNAYDAVEDSEEKVISVNTKKLSEDFFEISVTDSGPGIPASIREKIMQPFFTTKEIGKGTGIGLSISKGIVESHGGRIYLDTASEQTRMVITLPLLKENNLSLENAA